MLPGSSGSSVVEGQGDRRICGLRAFLVAGVMKSSADREYASSCIRATTFHKMFSTYSVATPFNLDALNLSIGAAFRVSLSYKMSRGPDDVTLALLNDGTKIGEGGGSI